MSAVIYAAIVVMWAVVLVPMWLRRHDAATESRSVDRFSTAMRTLSRRTTSGPGRRYVVMPRRSDGGVSVHVSGAAVPPERPAAPRPSAQPKTPRTRSSLVERRRRLLLGLLAVTFLSFLLAVTGVMGWVLQILVDLVLIAFCAHLRAQAKRARALSRQRRRAVGAAAQRPAAARRPAPAPRPQPAYQAAAGAADWPVEEEAAATGTEDGTWEPVRIPPPTYTLKPPAPVEVPSDIIDPLRDTDPYNTMAAIYDEPLAPGAEVIAAEPEEIETDLDEILQRRWAVND